MKFSVLVRKNLKNNSDLELSRMLAENKQEARLAFDELYSRYATKIFTYCCKILKNQLLAEDIFQETFTKLVENMRTEKEILNVGGYLIKIARNLCLNEKDKKIYHDLVQLKDFHLTVSEDLYETKQLNELLEAALDTLPEKYKEVIIMKEYMDLSYQEIADALGQSLANIRVNIFRGKNKLREIMSPLIEDLQRNI